MEEIHKTIRVGDSPDKAFHKFVDELNSWWPKEYSWSQDKLQQIKIDPKKDGLCTEIGPRSFRCDWGRVTEFDENKKIIFTWQISPERVPEPDPAKASEVSVSFHPATSAETEIELHHHNFENHGEGAAMYREALDSKQGWDYILQCYKKFVEQ